jgi:hypothetical protein
VPSVLFAPCHLLSLFTLGVPTGLVIDCGHNESLVLPISFLLLYYLAFKKFKEKYFLMFFLIGE